jgi:glutathione S-transferase
MQPNKTDLLIVIGNKTYSSSSLRAWLALKACAQPFREERISLYKPDGRARILSYSPSGKLPVLKHGAVTVRESLAICEYLAETFLQARLWPEDPFARAMARSVATEMHGGFASLRR